MKSSLETQAKPLLFVILHKTEKLSGTKPCRGIPKNCQKSKWMQFISLQSVAKNNLTSKVLCLDHCK